MHLQDTEVWLKKIKRILKGKRRREILYRLSLSLLLSFFIYFLLSIFHRRFYLFPSEWGLGIFISFLPFLFLFRRLPRRMDVIRQLEEKLDLKGCLFLVNDGLREGESEDLFKMAEEYASKRLEGINERDFLPPVPFYIYLLPLIFVFPFFFISPCFSSPCVKIFPPHNLHEGRYGILRVEAPFPRLFVYSDGNRMEGRKIKGAFLFLIPGKRDTITVLYRWFRKRIPIIPVPNPHLVKLTITYHYPEYLGIPPVVDTGWNTNVVAPVETRIEMAGESDLPLGKVTLGKKKFKVDGSSFRGRFIIEENDTVDLVLFDTTLTPSPEKLTFFIHPIPDRPPFITFLYPPSGTKLDETMATEVSIRAEDDYGLKEIIITAGEDRWRMKVEGEIEVEWEDTLAFPELFPGDSVVVTATARDMREQEYTARIVLHAPELEEIFEEIEVFTEKMGDEFREAEQTSEKLVEQMEDALEKGEITWEEAERIRETLEEHKRLVEKLERLKKLAEVLSSEEVSREMKLIEELLSSLDLETISQDVETRSLEELQLDEKRLLSALRMGRKMLEKIKKLMDLRMIKEEVEGVKEEQEKIGKEAPSSPEDYARREKSLAEKMEELEKELEKFKISGKVCSCMKRLSEKMEKGEWDEALFQKIMKNLENLSSRIENAEGAMLASPEDMERIKKLAFSLYFLLEEEEDVMDGDYEILKQAGIKDALRRAREEAEKLLLKTLAFSPRALAHINNAIRELNNPEDFDRERVEREIKLAMFHLLQQPEGGGSPLATLASILKQMRSLGAGMKALIPLPSPQREEGARKLAEQMRKLAEKAEGLGEMFSSLAEEMREMAKQLEKGMLDEKLLERQKKTLQHFIEAERAMRKRRFSKKRRSKPGLYYPPEIPHPPPDLGERKLWIKRQFEEEMKKGIPEGYRDMIMEYMRRITR